MMLRSVFGVRAYQRANMMTKSFQDHIADGDRFRKAGDAMSAYSAFARALNHEPRSPYANYRLGTCLLAREKPGEALAYFLTAHQSVPNKTPFNIAFAKAMIDSGETDRAASFLGQLAQAEPLNKTITHASNEFPITKSISQKYVGYASKAKKREAQKALDKLLQKHAQHNFDYSYKNGLVLAWQAPEMPVIWKILAVAALNVSSLIMAETAIRRALALQPGEVGSLRTLAQILNATQRSADAVNLLKSAYSENPTINLLHHICDLLRGGQRYREILEYVAHCRRNHSNDPSIILHLQGQALSEMGDLEGAKDAYVKALALAPKNPIIIGAAASFFESLVDSSHLTKLMQRAREDRVDLGVGALRQLEAVAFLRGGKPVLARTSILKALQRPNKPDLTRRSKFILGQAEDKSGNYPAAFEAYSEANQLSLDIFETNGPHDHAKILNEIATMRTALDLDGQFGPLEPAPSHNKTAKIAFILGFPRSGTTLLDTILRSHSLVEVVEEKPIFSDALAASFKIENSAISLKKWLAIDPKVMKEAYLRKMSDFAGETLSDNKVYIDKMPLNTRWAPFLHQIFPEALFIFAIRHPQDVAISNLFQDFAPNGAMMNMTNIRRIDNLYDQCFSLWDEFERKCKPNVERVRYEELVDDLEGTAGRVMRRLGLEWEDDQARFFETAMQRGRISTASRNQVSQKLYTSSKERWRNYAFAFQGDDTANLGNWAVKLGYSID